MKRRARISGPKNGLTALAVMLLVAALSRTALAAAPVAFTVDAKAAAGGDGSAARPWRTVAEAVAGVRAARASGAVKPGAGVTVTFAPGDYPVEEGLALTAADSGAADAPVVWRARDNRRRVRLTRGVRVPAALFRKADDPSVLARLPEEARGKVWTADVSSLAPARIPPLSDMFSSAFPPPLLFTGGRPAPFARWPNAGFATFTQGVGNGSFPKERHDDGTEFRSGAFVFDHPRADRWDFAAGVWLNGYWTHDWANFYVRAAGRGAVDGTNGVIRLAAAIPYGVLGETWGRKERRFYAFNLLEELDAPGEWWLDREKKRLYLYPLHGAPAETDETTLSFATGPILKIAGARHLRFEGLTFEYGCGDGVAAEGSDLAFEACRMANLGGCGMSVSGDRNVVRGCTVRNTGRAGIRIDGGDRRTLRRAESLVENCHVHDWALCQRTYAPGLGVEGCGVTLRGNRLHDAPHAAVLYGGNEHLFESNEVFRVLLETGDAGAYYTGRDWTTMGNVLRYNYTHDLGAGGEHANTMGFYFDDCDCGDEVYGNVFHNVARGILVGGGREHPIRNNVFSKCRIGLSIDTRGMTWKYWNSREHGGPTWLLEEKAKALDYTNGVWAAKYPLLAKIMRDHPREPLYNPVENNVFVDCTEALVELPAKASECLPRMAPIRGNLAIDTVGTNGVKTAKPDKRIAAGFRTVSGTPEKPFDAGFADPAHGDFTLRPDAWLRKEMPAFEPLPAMRPRTEVMFFFDAEDFTSERPLDAIRDLCNLFREEGATVHVALVGFLAQEIARRGRTDVIDALRPHLVGTQSMYHSVHPNVLEAADGADYAAAYARVAPPEREGIRAVEALTGRKALFAVPPGVSKSYVAMNVYAEAGLRFYCDTVVGDGRGGDWTFLNLRHYPYTGRFELESLIPRAGQTARTVDWDAILDRIASGGRELLYLHPCMAVMRQFWDGVNYNRTNAVAFGEWRVPEARAAADTQLYYARLRELLRRLKADGRFAFPTLAEKAAQEKPRADITRADVPKLRRHFAQGILPVDEPSWCVTDVFRATAAFLRGERTYRPGRAFGFIEKPYAVTNAVEVAAEDVIRAAEGLPTEGFLPSEIRVGAVTLGPGDFLRAGLAVLDAGAKSTDRVRVEPSDPLAALDLFKPLKRFHPAGTWVLTPEYRDTHTSDRLRWQVWTARRTVSPGLDSISN